MDRKSRDKKRQSWLQSHCKWFWCAFKVLLLSTIGWSGQVGAGLFDDDQARRRIVELQQQQSQFESRVLKLEELINNPKLFSFADQLQQMSSELATLRGMLEVQTHQLGEIDRREKELYTDLDTRLRALERGGSATDTAVPPSNAQRPVDGSSTTPVDVATSDQENVDYNAAFKQFRDGHYKSAESAFQQFLKRYPSSKLASNAWYWIGNAYTAQRDYRRALHTQQKLVSQYPNSPKLPDALLNIATAQQQLGDTHAARRTLEKLVANHPLSSAAEQAQRRLAK